VCTTGWHLHTRANYHRSRLINVLGYLVYNPFNFQCKYICTLCIRNSWESYSASTMWERNASTRGWTPEGQEICVTKSYHVYRNFILYIPLLYKNLGEVPVPTSKISVLIICNLNSTTMWERNIVPVTSEKGPSETYRTPLYDTPVQHTLSVLLPNYKGRRHL
jgi:hypothetical protein